MLNNSKNGYSRLPLHGSILAYLPHNFRLKNSEEIPVRGANEPKPALPAFKAPTKSNSSSFMPKKFQKSKRFDYSKESAVQNVKPEAKQKVLPVKPKTPFSKPVVLTREVHPQISKPKQSTVTRPVDKSIGIRETSNIKPTINSQLLNSNDNKTPVRSYRGRSVMKKSKNLNPHENNAVLNDRLATDSIKKVNYSTYNFRQNRKPIIPKARPHGIPIQDKQNEVEYDVDECLPVGLASNITIQSWLDSKQNSQHSLITDTSSIELNICSGSSASSICSIAISEKQSEVYMKSETSYDCPKTTDVVKSRETLKFANYLDANEYSIIKRPFDCTSDSNIECSLQLQNFEDLFQHRINRILNNQTSSKMSVITQSEQCVEARLVGEPTVEKYISQTAYVDELLPQVPSKERILIANIRSLIEFKKHELERSLRSVSEALSQIEFEQFRQGDVEESQLEFHRNFDRGNDLMNQSKSNKTSVQPDNSESRLDRLNNVKRFIGDNSSIAQEEDDTNENNSFVDQSVNLQNKDRREFGSMPSASDQSSELIVCETNDHRGNDGTVSGLHEKEWHESKQPSLLEHKSERSPIDQVSKINQEAIADTEEQLSELPSNQVTSLNFNDNRNTLSCKFKEFSPSSNTYRDEEAGMTRTSSIKSLEYIQSEDQTVDAHVRETSQQKQLFQDDSIFKNRKQSTSKQSLNLRTSYIMSKPSTENSFKSENIKNKEFPTGYNRLPFTNQVPNRSTHQILTKLSTESETQHMIGENVELPDNRSRVDLRQDHEIHSTEIYSNTSDVVNQSHLKSNKIYDVKTFVSIEPVLKRHRIKRIQASQNQNTHIQIASQIKQEIPCRAQTCTYTPLPNDSSIAPIKNLNYLRDRLVTLMHEEEPRDAEEEPSSIYLMFNLRVKAILEAN